MSKKPPTKQTLTAERLREIISYDPLTGFLTAKVSRPFAPAGKVLGTLTKKGYLTICIDCQRYYAHRLAWLYMTGSWPAHQVDHRDTNKARNVWDNLRDATNAVNRQNIRSAYASNPLHVLGVHRSVSGRRYISQIKAANKTVYLGTFDTPELAHTAYVEAKRRLHEGNTL